MHRPLNATKNDENMTAAITGMSHPARLGTAICKVECANHCKMLLGCIGEVGGGGLATGGEGNLC